MSAGPSRIKRTASGQIASDESDGGFVEQNQGGGDSFEYAEENETDDSDTSDASSVGAESSEGEGEDEVEIEDEDIQDVQDLGEDGIVDHGQSL
jgi:hypothetical protein